jgi:hypothetical protein
MSIALSKLRSTCAVIFAAPSAGHLFTDGSVVGDRAGHREAMP